VLVVTRSARWLMGRSLVRLRRRHRLFARLTGLEKPLVFLAAW
jgi:hypothetical protein